MIEKKRKGQLGKKDTAKTKVSSSGGYPSAVNEKKKTDVMNENQSCPDSEMDETELEQWAHLGRMEAVEIGQAALQTEVTALGSRMERIENALGTLIAEIQKQTK